MAHCVNNDLGLGNLIENQKGIWRCRQTAHGRIVHAGADKRIKREKIDDRLNAGLNALRALRGMSGNVVQYRV